MKISFLTKAVSKAQINVDWVVLAALVLGVGVVLLTSIGGILNGLNFQLWGEVGSRVTGSTTQNP